MPTAPESPDVSFEDLAEALQELRAQGLRLTSARRLVVEALFAAEGPSSAEVIAESLHRGGVPADLGAVYRNLETLERAGIARHVHIGHGPGLYALAGRREREYLTCERCGRVDAARSEAFAGVRTAIREAFGYQARFTHFPIVGLCPTCAASTVSDPTTRGSTMSDHGHSHDDGHGHSHDDDSHTHGHIHGGVAHSHPHVHTDGDEAVHDHDHVEHRHEHDHGGTTHSHPHVHAAGDEGDHAHTHDG